MGSAQSRGCKEGEAKPRVVRFQISVGNASSAVLRDSCMRENFNFQGAKLGSEAEVEQGKNHPNPSPPKWQRPPSIRSRRSSTVSSVVPAWAGVSGMECNFWCGEKRLRVFLLECCCLFYWVEWAQRRGG